MAPQQPADALMVPGDPCRLLPQDLRLRRLHQPPLPPAAAGKEGGQRRRIAGGQIPGVPMAQERGAPRKAALPGLGVQAPEAAVVVGDLIGQLRPKAGQGQAGRQGGAVFLRRRGQEVRLAVAQEGAALELVIPPDAAGDFVRRRNRLRQGDGGGEHRDLLHGPLPLRGHGLWQLGERFVHGRRSFRKDAVLHQPMPGRRAG